MGTTTHYMGEFLLPICDGGWGRHPEANPGTYFTRVTPKPEDVTCEPCRMILARHA